MAPHDDHDELADLLRRGYGADVDGEFAEELLKKLHREQRPRPRRLPLAAASIAAAAMILLGVGAALHLLRPEPPVAAESIVVRGRLLRWDAPIAEVAVAQAPRGEALAATVYVDLTEDMRALARRVPEAPAGGLFAAQLSAAAGGEIVFEFTPVATDGSPEGPGRILGWSGAPGPPPRGRELNLARAVVHVVRLDEAKTPTSPSAAPLRDEWGMPR